MSKEYENPIEVKGKGCTFPYLPISSHQGDFFHNGPQKGVILQGCPHLGPDPTEDVHATSVPGGTP